MQYREIIDFIDKQISEHNRYFIEKMRIFRSLLISISVNFSKSFSIIEIIIEDLRNRVFSEVYDLNEPTKTFSNSEILQKITLDNYGKFYTTAISLQSIALMFPNEHLALFEIDENSTNDKLLLENANEKCKTVTISKYYISLDALEADNNTNIYFDKRYDKTNYGILEDTNNYGKQLLTMNPDELEKYITEDLIKRKRMSPDNAAYLANTLVNGHKKVIEGQFAILYKGYNEKYSEQMNYYIRKDNKWVLDENVNKDNINTDETSILCNSQPECINVYAVSYTHLTLPTNREV